uniref:Uncharacterized protein n=1 Tax=viral metagenome TaxID=1070528 RepID=A0A6M3LTM2_9ZZZZ
MFTKLRNLYLKESATVAVLTIRVMVVMLIDNIQAHIDYSIYGDTYKELSLSA